MSIIPLLSCPSASRLIQLTDVPEGNFCLPVSDSMFWAAFGARFWSVFGGGAILKNRGVGFVGDCCYLCMIYILSVVCLGVRGS